MKIAEAKQYLEGLIQDSDLDPDSDYKSAIGLGIEALSEIIEARDYGLIDVSKSLPSETNE